MAGNQVLEWSDLDSEIKVCAPTSAIKFKTEANSLDWPCEGCKYYDLSLDRCLINLSKMQDPLAPPDLCVVFSFVILHFLYIYHCTFRLVNSDMR